MIELIRKESETADQINELQEKLKEEKASREKVDAESVMAAFTTDISFLHGLWRLENVNKGYVVRKNYKQDFYIRGGKIIDYENPSEAFGDVTLFRRTNIYLALKWLL